MNAKLCTKLVCLAFALAYLQSCSVFPEATFQLSGACQVPKSMDLPGGISRARLEIELNTYVTESGRTAEFTVYGQGHEKIKTVDGIMPGLQPTTIKLLGNNYFSYDLVHLDGVDDVIIYDFDPGPTFCIIDGPTVLRDIRLDTARPSE